MDTLTVALPVLEERDAHVATRYIEGSPYLVYHVGVEACRCLGEAARAVERGRETVSLTVTTLGLPSLSSACQALCGETYSDHPAVPILRAIAEACEAALARRAA